MRVLVPRVIPCSLLHIDSFEILRSFSFFFLVCLYEQCVRAISHNQRVTMIYVHLNVDLFLNRFRIPFTTATAVSVLLQACRF